MKKQAQTVFNSPRVSVDSGNNNSVIGSEKAISVNINTSAKKTKSNYIN